MRLSVTAWKDTSMAAKPVVMVGVELHAKRVHAYLTTDGGRTIEAFAVHRRFLKDGVTDEFLGRPVVAFEELHSTHPPESHDLCVAVGYRDVNQARARVWQEGLDRGYEHVNYVSSYARCWEPSTIGTRGTLIVEDANVQPYATVGDDCWISGARIGHDARSETIAGSAARSSPAASRSAISASSGPAR